MPKQENNFQKFPQKTITLNDGATVEFKKLYDDQPSGLVHYPQSGGYQELYPSVYSNEIEGEGFVKIYNFVPTEYVERRAFINYDQYSLHNYAGINSNRGYYLSLKGSKKDGDVKGLAKMVGVKVETLTEHIDRLQDCFLLHRVRRLDLNGCPNELVYHSGFTAKQLDANNQKINNVIVDRIARSATKSSRQKGVVKSNGKNGGFGYLNRKATDERFQFDYNVIKKAFGDNSRSFADFALEFFKTHKHLLERHKSDFEKGYRIELNRKMSDWGIGGNSAREFCYVAANKFRTIYCPTFEELCS